ncbi:MAG TPA: sugar ABC transporter substrate-binding protein [Candidatus Enterocloster faecavium]|uniref:Sugar ABC transporter substrate-binding protein n=1 Tax=Candidatus Enterocloster faecavium TaxID=2838560 RepID=A0A9D2L6Z2_9FIRM|nr:sugar ABC transporter substrate-binding protein [Candidatus Enterocloster faecavium]
MNKLKKLILLSSFILVSSAISGCSKSASADGKTHLTFQIWDVAQRDGMQAICDAYTQKNPNVEIEVQVTSWSEYWTKLEAAAISNQMPDIFWMHTNEILKYADYGKIADLTDLYDDTDPEFFQKHYSEVSLSNIQGSDGRYYGVPKDKDTVGLVYNKEMFDAAGVSYPDENWTWDDLCDASQKIYDATGKYGYMAYGDDQLGYWNFVYQKGGYILADDNVTGGFDNPATRDAMRFYIDLQKNDWCPDQNYFAETSPGTAFFSGQGAMFLEGNWNILSEMTNYPNMEGKWDVAVLPKCPAPVQGDGRATISNGLCYATSPTGKNLEIVKDVLRFFGSEEGQRIQGESGAAIPAYTGLEDTWIHVFDQFDYRLNVECFVDMFDYSVQSVNNKYRPQWKPAVTEALLKIYSGEYTFEQGMDAMQEAVNSAAQDD